MAKLIRHRMEVRKLSGSELARRVGVSQAAMSDILRGKTKSLRGSTMAGLCRELDLSPHDLQQGVVSPRAQLSRAEEAELLRAFRALTTEDRGHVIAMVAAFEQRMVAAPRSKSAGRDAGSPAAKEERRRGSKKRRATGRDDEGLPAAAPKRA